MPNEAEKDVIFLHLESTDKMESNLQTGKYHGFGDNGSEMFLRGEVKKITVSKNGFSQFSLWIDTDGKLTITDYAGLGFQQSMPTNLVLTPSRQWRER